MSFPVLEFHPDHGAFKLQADRKAIVILSLDTAPHTLVVIRACGRPALAPRYNDEMVEFVARFTIWSASTDSSGHIPLTAHID